MNILYLYSSAIDPTKGGIQRVTYVLSEYFRRNGHCVYYLGIDEGNSPWQIVMPERNLNSKRNREFIRNVVKKYRIDVAIFQAGISPLYASWGYEAKAAGVYLLSCIHNSMLGSVENFESVFEQKFKRFHCVWLLPVFSMKWMKYVLKKIYISIKRPHYLKLLRCSDRVILLSDKFYSELGQFLDITPYKSKLCAIPNPVSFDVENGCCRKEKRVLYVGRINSKQKRVDLLLRIWELVTQEKNDWFLDIVGDGPYLEEAKNLVVSKGIPNVCFYGFMDPKPFYQRSKIFLMTSSFEGFGIVLIEGMQYGVVPMAFESYLSVTDIITDGWNGILVEPFNVSEYASRLIALMNNESLLEIMSEHGRQKASDFSLHSVGNLWMSLLTFLR